MHALRGQLATAAERLAAVDAMAARVAGLRTSLASITAAANWGEAIFVVRVCDAGGHRPIGSVLLHPKTHKCANPMAAITAAANWGDNSVPESL